MVDKNRSNTHFKIGYLKISMLLVLVFFIGCKEKSSGTNKEVEDTYVKAPFEVLDSYATNDWWNRPDNKIINLKVPREEVVAFALYTVHNNKLKMSAQLFPLYPDEPRSVVLYFKEDDIWVEKKKSAINELGWLANFEVGQIDTARDISYKVVHNALASFEGIIRKTPVEQEDISMAALSCNSLTDRGKRENYVRNINYQNPDLVFFAGDQSYDHIHHTTAWLKWGIQFRELFRNRPCITIPDDHDVGQPNLWGEGGKKSNTKDGSDGGYMYHPEYVKMVERAQTSHLPDAFDATPIEQGIGVYYTSYNLGYVDFAIIEDRKFKSGPKGKIPQQGPRPDHIINPDYDAQDINLKGLKLLGERQLDFLDQWRKDQGAQFKVVLSQTGFSGSAHLHGKKMTRLHADLDSNGWPQDGRNRALQVIQKANAIHIAGDQHLATVVKNGIDTYEDGPWSFIVPAIENTYYSRWWWPEDEKPLVGAAIGSLPWTGKYKDGFDNKLTMYAYANPDQPANGAGYGLIRFQKTTNSITFECWPRNVDVSSANAQEFEGWPITIDNPKTLD